MTKPRQSEHSFQAWADRFIDRVVLPCAFTTAIDPAGVDMARIERRMSLIGRGLKPGMPDIFVCQYYAGYARSAWIELKRCTQLTDQQSAVHKAMMAAGQRVFVCRTMPEVHAALHDAGFTLHGNAHALADEYEMRVGARETTPAKPRAPRTARASPSKIKRAHAAGLWAR